MHAGTKEGISERLYKSVYKVYIKYIWSTVEVCEEQSFCLCIYSGIFLITYSEDEANCLLHSFWYKTTGCHLSTVWYIVKGTFLSLACDQRILCLSKLAWAQLPTRHFEQCVSCLITFLFSISMHFPFDYYYLKINVYILSNNTILKDSTHCVFLAPSWNERSL